MKPVDLITLELVQEYLVSTVREMRATMIMTAHSSIIYEGHDFSCALLDAQGRLAAQSEDSPAHVIPLPWQVREAIAFYGDDIHDGDAILVNDPYTSGTHLNDVAMIVPHFDKGRLIAFIVTRAHWGDVGGMTPGSISGRCTEVFQEGLRIPFVKVHSAGKPAEELLELIFSNVRGRAEREGDFHAMLACCHTAKVRLDELLERFGADELAACMEALLKRSEQRMRKAISSIAPGVYHYEDYLDYNDATGLPVLLTAAVTVNGDSLSVDFEGSAPQVLTPINASLAVTTMGTFVALKALLDPHAPINHGAFMPVTVTAPPGSVVNVRPPGAVGGYTEIRRRVESVIMGALAQAAPRYVAGDIKGTSNHTYIGSYNAARGVSTIFYEYPAGGTGGFLEHDGGDAMRAYDEGDFSSILPAEAVELEHALLVESCTLRTDSCGDGDNRGGVGLRREIRLLADAGRFSELSDRNVVPPYGVCGGYSAHPNRFSVIRDNEVIEPSPVPGKISGFAIRKDDIVVLESAGGGGYGDAIERVPERVLRDVELGYITRERAAARYGVVIKDGEVDFDATLAKRKSLGAQKMWFDMEITDSDQFDLGRRVVRLSVSDAARLGGPGVLAEIINPKGAPLRFWVDQDDDVKDGTIGLGPIARQILAATSGHRLEVRALTGVAVL
jgi:N-methylhydantoinase B